MQVALNDDVILDSRRAVWLPKQRTLVLADLFLGMGAARRKRPEPQAVGGHQDIWERLLSLLGDLDPAKVVLLGDIKPGQGTVEGDEAEELRQLLKKLGSGGREVVQVVGHPERSVGPALNGTKLAPVDQAKVGPFAFMHRRRIFVYPRAEGGGLWINGGVHPLFALPTKDPKGAEDWLRVPAFLYTGFALVMPPFVPYAQGYEVMQPERLPRQARAWSLLAERIAPLDLAELPPCPEHLKALTRPPRKGAKAEE
jgi:metallophosphoesterase superfamily enzyme